MFTTFSRRTLVLGLLAFLILALLAGALTSLASAPAARQSMLAPNVTLGGVDLGDLPDYLFFFADARTDANWQGATKGFVGDVAVDGIQADERTSGGVPFAGTIYTNDSTLSAWQNIVNQNSGQASGSTGNVALISQLETSLNSAFTQINALAVTPGYASASSTSLDNLDTTNGIAETFVINITSGLGISSKIDITGDAGDIFILRWDTDANFSNGYDGQVKFQSGGAIVPHGGLKPTNFIHVAGDIGSSGGGSTPASPYPQGPRLNDGQGALCTGCQDFSGGGYFTGYWLTTGSPDNPADGTHSVPYGDSSSLSNGIFVGGWYSINTKFSMTSGTSGVYVSPPVSTPTPTPTPTLTPTPTRTPTPTPTATAAPPNSIGDYVWNDINGNGLQDDGANRGLNTVTVRLYLDDGDGVYEPGAGDALVGSQDTAGDGNYLFAGLASGDYWVDVDEGDLPGYTQIIGAESEPQPLFIELLPGEDFTTADFGFAGRGSISGVVFYDWDESGDQGPGEDGIPNVQVCLYRDADNDGLVDFGSSPIACQNTLFDGSYIFTNQLPGDYLVVETPPPGLENTTPYIRDVLLIVVGSSGSAPGNDFGHVNFGSIGDFIYLDTNGNGSQDLGENLGIAGVPVTVKNVSTLEETTVTSGPTGLYLVDGLAPGVYEVSTPASWPGLTRTTASPKTVNLGQGQNYVLADFGYIAPTSVQLASFTATAHAGGVQVRWVTSYEREQEGFRVWRATAADGVYEAVSGVIEAANSEMGASYEWLDAGAAGRTWYKIESLPDGQMFGPVGAEAEQGLTRLFTPLVFRRH